MAYPTGVNFRMSSPFLGAQPLHETSTTQKHPLGMVVKGSDVTYGEGEFIYLKGVASTAQGDLCCYDSKAGTTVRAISGGSGANGPAGVAMSANVASQYGWYQISGATPVKAGTVNANAACYLTATAGQIDDAVVAGDKIEGMATRSTASGGYATVQLDHPSITGESVTSNVSTLESNVTALQAFRQITLSAAAEAGDAIVVTGQVKDLAGVNIASAVEVVVRTIAVTDDKGDITVTTGTSRKVVNPATGPNEAWITTNGTGGFAFSVANDVAEVTVVEASTDDASPATLKLTFA